MSQSIQITDSYALIGAHPMHHLDVTPEMLIQEMDRNRISSALVVSTLGILYSYDTGNDDVLAASKTNARLIPVATIDPRRYFGSESDLQSLKSRGFKAIRFYPAEQGWPIDSAAFAQLLKKLAPSGMPVMINAGRPGDPTAVARAAGDYPGSVVLCSVSLDVLADTIAVMSEHANLMVETHELHVPGGLEAIAERAGANRIVFGSGAPSRSIGSSLYYVTSAGLSDADKMLMLGGNIRRVLEAE
jgi:predicted TIM-barrel fold metal-dependent hydrolase